MASAPPAARGFFPLDDALGLVAGQCSPWVVEAMVRLGARLPFGQVPALLAFFTGVQVDAETVRRVTEAAGAALVAAETEAVERLERDQPEPPLGPPVQQVSADGAMVPLVGGEWAEVKTVAIGRVAMQGNGTVHSDALSYFSRLADHATFARLAWGELYRRGTPTAGVVVGVMDGSEWLQGFLDLHRPDAVRILDFPHAVEHLAAAAQATFGPGTAATAAWLATQRHTLRHGDPAAVLAALDALPVAGAADPSAAEALRGGTRAYFTKRWAQIQYAAYVAQGYPIGSGMVESANKLVVETRLKGSGMHWARTNVDPMLALRDAICSDRWEAIWPAVAQRLCRRRRQARRGSVAVPAVRATPPPPPPSGTVSARVGLPDPPAAAPHPPTIVSGKPTMAHPWKRGLLHTAPSRSAKT
jgi:hypothetical protein